MKKIFVITKIIIDTWKYFDEKCKLYNFRETKQTRQTLMQLHRTQFSLITKDYQTEKFKVPQKDFNKKYNEFKLPATLQVR